VIRKNSTWDIIHQPDSTTIPGVTHGHHYTQRLFSWGEAFEFSRKIPKAFPEQLA